MLNNVQKLTNRIYFISPGQAPVYPYSNSLWIDDDYPTIIDFGAGRRAYSGIEKERIAFGLFSHAHFDHLHCNVLFPKAIFMAGEPELPFYQQESGYERILGYDLWSTIMPEYPPRPRLSELRPTDANVPVVPGFRYIEIGQILQDNGIIDTGHVLIRTLHLPGHSPGHFGFYFEKENILFSGDLDLVASGPCYNNSTSDIGDLIASIDRIISLNPGTIVSSHRRIQSVNLHEKLLRYKKVIIDRLDFLYDYLAEPRTLKELYSLKLITSEARDVYDIFWNRISVHNNLKYMLKQNLIRKLDENRFVRH
jgi:glyoxylase-like metal-dependent hydrolase (beta-lactamase superfamily II)